MKYAHINEFITRFDHFRSVGRFGIRDPLVKPRWLYLDWTKDTATFSIE